MVLRSPLRTMTAATVTDVLAVIDDQPHVADDAVERSAAIIGGGWLSCLGFTPGVSAACFYDSLLRWHQRLELRNARTGGARRRREHRAQRLAPPAG